MITASETLTRNSSGDETPESVIALFSYPSRLTAATEGFPWDDLHKILHGAQRMAEVQNGEKCFNPVSIGRMKVTDDRQTTEGFAIAKSQT